jgi:hypothetical protein
VLLLNRCLITRNTHAVWLDHGDPELFLHRYYGLRSPSPTSTTGTARAIHCTELARQLSANVFADLSLTVTATMLPTLLSGPRWDVVVMSEVGSPSGRARFAPRAAEHVPDLAKRPAPHFQNFSKTGLARSKQGQKGAAARQMTVIFAEFGSTRGPPKSSRRIHRAGVTVTEPTRGRGASRNRKASPPRIVVPSTSFGRPLARCRSFGPPICLG